MRKIIPLSFIFLMILASACSVTRNGQDDGRIELVLVQVNDVYEIAPLSGNVGGMARVASLKKQYQQKNPNTLLIMAGDFLSPSVYNSLSYEGKPIRGRQMVEAMNVAGMDLAIFGNHEFDIKESELQSRLNESIFNWVSTNTFQQTSEGAQPFKKTANGKEQPIPEYIIHTLRDADGTVARVGFISITLPFNKAAYVIYTDPLSTAKKMYAQLKDSVDAVVAITHQFMEDDRILANNLPQLALIAGGHEHDMRFETINGVKITKAHANARTAYVITLEINKRKNSINSKAHLVYLNESIPLDSATNVAVEKWTNIADASFKNIGFDSKKIVLVKGEPLDGREAEIRSRPTNLTKQIILAMQEAAPKAEVVLLNAGSIRVDDIIAMPVTQYDIIRAMPFGGGIQEVDMKGKLLKQILDQGEKNKGIGGYLLYNEQVKFDNQKNEWTLKSAPIQDEMVYRIALSDFLFSGLEANLEFLNKQNPGIIKTYDVQSSCPLSDIRHAIIKYFENHPG
ncbi:MAG: bifunctional metallophosphatase/5'-nucleotidase [Chitinophagaceae bacterium]|nr:bifunctional metallophosphatase/5'-nucleotidase [Chitinophagaceae bacterium]